jgi:putative CocE/NonD family hydrolase
MRETAFMGRWMAGREYSIGRVEDVVAMVENHPFYDDYWRSKTCDLSRIDVPAYVVASWADQGLHTRGTLEAFKQMSSKQKWLEVHGRRKWEYYLEPESVERQRMFFDHFLKGTDDRVLDWPPVRIEIRDRHYVGAMRPEREWPLARTEFKPLFLDAATASLVSTAPTAEAAVRYDGPTGSTAFEHRFDADTELTGHMKLKLWVEADGSDDMDLFVSVQKFDASGAEVPFAFFSVFDDGPVALGWLRASHRELDPVRSRPEQPWYLHQREQRLSPGEVVPVEIEILASSTIFHAGERLRVVIQGRDFFKPTHIPKGPVMKHETRNRGEHVIRTGGRYDSHLLIPVIPETTE